MTTWSAYSDAPAFGADRDMGDAAEIAIDGDDRAQPLAVALDGSASAEEISQTLLAHVGNRDNIGSGLYP